MPFGTFTIGTRVYQQSSEGIYILQGIDYNAPKDEIRIRGARQTKSGRLSGGIVRLLQKDATDSTGKTVRYNLVENWSCEIEGTVFPTSDVDQAATDIATVIDSPFLTRFLRGES